MEDRFYTNARKEVREGQKNPLSAFIPRLAFLCSIFTLLSASTGNAQSWTVYDTSNSGLPNDDVPAIAIDGAGNKWIGTSGGGLGKFDGANWIVYDPSNSGLPDDRVPAIAIEGSGNKWIGTENGGLANFESSNWTVYNSSNSGLPDDYIRAIAIDDSGNKWIGTDAGGLAKFDGSNWTVYNQSNTGLPIDYVRAIAIDDSGNKWIGTDFGGLARFDGSNWTLYDTSNSGLPNDNVFAISIDESGNKWIGTYGGGLAKFDGSNWTVYDKSNSGLPNNDVPSLAIDSSGNKWIGTIGGGLAKFDGGNWTVYNTSNSGLPDNTVNAITVNGGFNKWIGTNGGGGAVFEGCPDYKQFSELVCDDDYTVPSGDTTYTSSGTYHDTLTNSSGCDSILEIDLTIDSSSSASITEKTCGPYTVPSGDTTYSTSGIYKDTIPNSAGCDSLITIDLTVGSHTSASIQDSACDSYTVPSGDTTYTSSGTYKDTIPNSDGCDSIMTIDVTILGSSPSLSLSGDDASCNEVSNGSVTVFPSGGTTPYSYQWSNGDTTAIIDSLSPGTYSVTVTDSVGCQASASYTVGTKTSLSLSTSVFDADCGTNNGFASVSVSGGDSPYSYAWSSGDTTSTADSLSSGTYTVQVKDSNGCKVNASVTVDNTTGPTASIDSVTPVSCPGDSNGAIDISVSGGTKPYSYKWNTGDTTQDISGIPAGPYQVAVIDADSCYNVLNVTVDEPDSLELDVSTLKANCGQSDGEASVNVSGGSSPYDYQWSSGGDSATETGLSYGTYTVTVTDSNGCIDSATASVSENGGPKVTVDHISHASCGDSTGSISVSVSGTSPFTYNWTTGATSKDLKNVAPGHYALMVEDGSGCKTVIDTTVKAAKPPKVPICVVSVDSNSTDNLVIWEKPAGSSIEAYNIYKESFQAGVYKKIGTVHDSALSTFVDTNSDPRVQSYRYKIASVDACGNESPLSKRHKTIHLSVNRGVNDEINLIWDDYKGFSYQSFYIHRYTSSTGWQTIDSIPSTDNSYTDLNAPTANSIEYLVSVKPPYGTCTATRAKDYNNTISNAGTLSGSGGGGDDDSTSVQEHDEAEGISIHPNPTQDKVRIELSESINASQIILRDLTGRVLQSKSISGSENFTMDIEGESGMYLVELRTEGGRREVRKVLKK